MSSQAKRSLRAGAHLCAPQGSIERQLRRFRPELNGAVRALAGRHPRLAQLALSFPALLAAIVRPRPKVNSRAVAAAAIAGAPLAELTGMAGVPMWLRRIPPEMLPAAIPELPDSFFLRRRIVNHFPRAPKAAPQWFDRVSFAARWSDEAFAVRCAQIFATRRPPRRRRAGNMGLLCLWAWYSNRLGTMARNLMARPWNADMEYKAALDAVLSWREALDLHLHLGSRYVEELWHKPGFIGGYEFVPLRTAAEIEAEARAMQNCLRTYGELVAQDTTRLWSVRREGLRIATLEIGCAGNSPVPAIQQLCSARNESPSRDVWIAAHRCLHEQALHICNGPEPDWHGARPNRQAWQQLWKPYWLAKRIPAWLPLVRSRHTLFEL
jgi:hypothetical protein